MELINSLTKIADALQCPLKYKDGAIEGKSSASLAIAPGAALNVTLDARKAFMGPTNGVLFHVAGDLYLLAAHFVKMNALSAFLIDGEKAMPAALFSQTDELKDVVSSLRPHIVDSFTYKSADKTWINLRLPN